MQKTEEEVKSMAPVNILVAGKTGVGKSTLINAVFRENLTQTGIGKPVTKHLERITKEGIPLVLFDTKGFELNEQVQKEVRKEVLEEIQRARATGDRSKEIHAVWYCISSASHRLESFEEGFLRELSEKLPVILVLTQSILEEETSMLMDYICSLKLKLEQVIPVVAKPYRIGSQELPVTGLKALVHETLRLLPEEVEPAFINAQKVDVMKKAELARKWSRGFITETFMVGFTPIPFADAPILASSQVAMIAKITSIFGVSMNKALVTSIVSSVTGVSGAVYTGRALVSNLLKMIPGAGTVVGGIISGSTAALITTALAYAYINLMVLVATAEYKNATMKQSEIIDFMQKELKKQMKIIKKEKPYEK
ncbi:GTPase [Proteiniclasticum sp.]|uniref:YcjF family protein n=1 Tax=Proteiniclasticum sp. TaxID=2053595 RepID=UPI0025D09EC1|nr:GTPase [Proteiniclasticum sp.]